MGTEIKKEPQELVLLKKELKKFEREFERDHGREPSWNDIINHPIICK